MPAHASGSVFSKRPVSASRASPVERYSAGSYQACLDHLLIHVLIHLPIRRVPAPRLASRPSSRGRRRGDRRRAGQSSRSCVVGIRARERRPTLCSHGRRPTIVSARVLLEQCPAAAAHAGTAGVVAPRFARGRPTSVCRATEGHHARHSVQSRRSRSVLRRELRREPRARRVTGSVSRFIT